MKKTTPVKFQFKRGARVTYTDAASVEIPEGASEEEALSLARRAIRANFEPRSNEDIHIIRIGK